TRETGAQRWQLMGYAGQRAVRQYLPIPPAPQTNSPLHAGGVIDLQGGYGGLIRARPRQSRTSTTPQTVRQQQAACAGPVKRERSAGN
ncbi:hypothetical protein C7E17_24055, partial [Stenotrophomonas maltophilia]